MAPVGPALQTPCCHVLQIGMLLCSCLGVLQLRAGEQTNAPVYNITLITDSRPDFTDIGSYLRSITSQHATPQEKAIAIWRWSQRLRKQTAYPTEDGHEVLDPIFFFNNYGYTMCGIISGINNSLFLNLGWKTHYVQLGDHTVGECSWDDGKTWHMFDNSTSIYCFNDNHDVASVREIEKNPRLYLENFAPECGTNPVKGLKDHQGWRIGADHPVENRRTLANGMDSFLPPNEIIDDHLAIRWGARYCLNLRPGENYTRYFKNLDRPSADPHFYRPLHDKDVEGEHEKNIRANGVWHYAPNLTDPATQKLIYADSGVTWTAAGVKGPGWVIFKVSAANVVTSAKITLKSPGARVSVSRTAGIIWNEAAAALKNEEIDLVDQVAGVTEFLVKVELPDAQSVLAAITIDTITQISRAAMPALVRGPNQIQFRLGSQSETITFSPPVRNGQHKKTVADEKLISVNPKPYFNAATLFPAASHEPAYVTWKIDAPTPIESIDYGGNVCTKGKQNSVALLHAWDGKSFVEDFKKNDSSHPYDKVVNQHVDEIPANTQSAWLRYQFESGNEKWAIPGIQAAWMAVHHKPRVTGFTPVEVTYCWEEHREDGNLERQHTQLITSPEFQYSINVGGFRDPTMKWIRMNLKGFGAEGTTKNSGYSDGEENAPASKPERAVYHWGKNVALGKSYKLEGLQSDKNPDAGGDLTDGITMPPDTYVSIKWMPTNVIFAKDVSPVATLDLNEKQTIAAVRICAGQSDDFHLTYPDSIKVEVSGDGQTFSEAGSAQFNQVFDPPADFVRGEHEESSQFDVLPAGGRLAYAYRIIFNHPLEARFVKITCHCRKGWGVLLSEIQVFDTVKVETNVPPAVVLPPLTTR